jgi:hypothetical protein
MRQLYPDLFIENGWLYCGKHNPPLVLFRSYIEDDTDASCVGREHTYKITNQFLVLERIRVHRTGTIFGVSGQTYPILSGKP